MTVHFDRSTLAGTAIARARGWNVSAACNARMEILAGARPVTRVSPPNISPQPPSAEMRTQNRCGSDVFDAQDFDLLLAGRGAHPDDVALLSAHQSPRDRRLAGRIADAGGLDRDAGLGGAGNG